eukprot:CAMPEP_0173377470 /NCGR_PEP_ID=MMETSP1356-20130122/704_1 /TAXON_ID=77927 ORGANISM="Hemiselmis virescens, Strain PCC157" /NCGR_SAMPLE_ID=MMETSP1356 /ASSEMBLY_ACC=CAM_ASM_000847 /LENGTH=112 /DNA_ID=CAMNT_0014330231 /DNA_START=374 /DNA_END=708 /DNA_ORIENTATION=+
MSASSRLPYRGRSNRVWPEGRVTFLGSPASGSLASFSASDLAAFHTPLPAALPAALLPPIFAQSLLSPSSSLGCLRGPLSAPCSWFACGAVRLLRPAGEASREYSSLSLSTS